MTELIQAHQKPVLLKMTGIITLLSGLVNIIWGVMLSLNVLGSFLGLLCFPLTILPVALGITEILYSIRVFNAQPHRFHPSYKIAGFEILCFMFGNLFSMIVGILALIFYKDLIVKEYISGFSSS